MNALAIIASQPLPSDVDAEQAVLGIVLFENAAIQRLTEQLTPDSFGSPLHARLWELTTRLIERGRLAEPTALHERMKGDQDYEASGALAYLLGLIDKCPSPSLINEYAQRVGDAGRRRSIIQIAGEAMQAARDPDQEPFGVVASMEAGLSAVMDAAAPDGHTLIDARTAAERMVARLDEEAETGVFRGTMTGHDCIDRALGGMAPNELIILAGRPSMGKTALARSIGIGAARKHPDKLVPFFALEVDQDQLSRRTLSQLSYETGGQIPYREMKHGSQVRPEHRAALADLSKRVPTNFILDDTAVLTLEHVRRRLMTLRRRAPLALAIIDYLQIMDLPVGYGVNMTTAIGAVTKGLKQLSKQIGCPIMLLSQLSRKVEERDNKRPQLADLRDSGAIEQDATSVLFAYRDVYYLEREGPRRGVSVEEHQMAIAGAYRTMEVICAKSREGPIGTTRQRYIAECDVVENESTYP